MLVFLCLYFVMMCCFLIVDDVMCVCMWCVMCWGMFYCVCLLLMCVYVMCEVCFKVREFDVSCVVCGEKYFVCGVLGVFVCDVVCDVECEWVYGDVCEVYDVEEDWWVLWMLKECFGYETSTAFAACDGDGDEDEDEDKDVVM